MSVQAKHALIQKATVKSPEPDIYEEIKKSPTPKASSDSTEANKS